MKVLRTYDIENLKIELAKDPLAETVILKKEVVEALMSRSTDEVEDLREEIAELRETIAELEDELDDA